MVLVLVLVGGENAYTNIRFANLYYSFCLSFLSISRYYIEMKGQPGSPREEVENDLANFVKNVLDRLLEPEKNNLKKVV